MLEMINKLNILLGELFVDFYKLSDDNFRQKASKLMIKITFVISCIFLSIIISNTAHAHCCPGWCCRWEPKTNPRINENEDEYIIYQLKRPLSSFEKKYSEYQMEGLPIAYCHRYFFKLPVTTDMLNGNCDDDKHRSKLVE